MADTRQVVSWCLDFQCKLRTASTGNQPYEALMQTGRARDFSRDELRKGETAGVHGDIYVTSYTHESGGPDGKSTLWRSYPGEGYIISKEFAPVGGVEGLRTMCSTCPANTTPVLFAGCAGVLIHCSDDMEAELQGILSRSNLGQDFEAAFLKATPLWYGLWAQSPLSLSALRVIRTLFSEWVHEKGAAARQSGNFHITNQLDSFSDFVRATEIAEKSGIRLSVSLSPPGHTDGFNTIFPHCPRCKAAADVKHWQRHYPTDPYTCRVCGEVYSLAETASSTPMEDDGPELREILGQSEFEIFAKDYLMALGAGEDEAIQIVAFTEEKNRQRKLKLTADRLRRELERKYVLGELCRGLNARPPDDYHGAYPPWFKADDFVKLVQRCERIRAYIAYMHHENASGDVDRNITRKRVPGGIEAPGEVLQSWLNEGCDGWFCANIILPDQLLDTLQTI